MRRREFVRRIRRETLLAFRERNFVKLGLPFRRRAVKRGLDHRHLMPFRVGYLIGDFAGPINHRKKLWREYQYTGLAGFFACRRVTDSVCESLGVVVQ